MPASKNAVSISQTKMTDLIKPIDEPVGTWNTTKEPIKRTQMLASELTKRIIGTNRIPAFDLITSDDTFSSHFPETFFQEGIITDAKIILVTYHTKDQYHAK